MLYKCFVLTGLNAAKQTRGFESVLVLCWVGGPALRQRRVDKCFAPKRNNKFCLIHSLYNPQEPLKNNIAKAIDITSV